MTPMENSKTIQSVARAMAILECVAAADSNAALGQISSELALNKSTVHARMKLRCRIFPGCL